MEEFNKYTSTLEAKIVDSYEDSVTMEEAEKLAGEFLVAQLRVSEKLRTVSLDARMRKSGVKAVRAAVYKEASTSGEGGKKPTEAAIEAIINTNGLVNDEQGYLDGAEVDKEELERLFSVYQQAHHHFRGIAKGGM